MKLLRREDGEAEHGEGAEAEVVPEENFAKGGSMRLEMIVGNKMNPNH